MYFFFENAGEEIFLSLVPELLCYLEDLGSAGRQLAHYDFSLYLEHVPHQVHLLQLVGIFVYEHNAVLGGVKGLTEVVETRVLMGPSPSRGHGSALASAVREQLHVLDCSKWLLHAP